MTDAAAARDVVARRFRRQAEHCADYGSALTATLLTSAAADVEAGGVTAALLLPHAGEPAGSVLSLRFAGALHRLVLEGAAPRLARHYPSVGGMAPVDAVWPAAEQAVRKHLPRLRELVRRPVQTNEVGRSAALLGVLQHAAAATGLPVRLLEIGASAGLNLRCDAFRYDVDDDRTLGDGSSAVVLRHPWSGGPSPPGPVPTIVARAGCDPAPLDPASTEGRLTLLSYVWADQVERLDRLRAALDIAARSPVTVDAAPAVRWLPTVLAEPAPGVVTVVWHSVVWQYLTSRERDALSDVLAVAGARATAAAPLVHAGMEPTVLHGGASSFRIEATLWPGGRTVHLADCHGHGPPVAWTGQRL